MTSDRSVRRWTFALLAVVASSLVVLWGVGRSFVVFLAPGYVQNVFGITASRVTNLGGVVVLQDGTVISAECLTSTTRLHVYDATRPAPTSPHGTTTLHEETIYTSLPGGAAIPGGCGIAYYPGTDDIYANMNDGSHGLSRITLSHGNPHTPLAATTLAAGFPGNALGIAVDPVTLDIIYAGAACKPATVQPPICTLYRFNVATSLVTPFAAFPTTQLGYVDGIEFDRSGGNYVFLTNRAPNSELVVLTRAGTLVRQIALAATPLGIGFHASSPKFVVTNNIDGSMTRIDFPNDDYSAPPASITDFALGGFRGDLMQAGPDGCLYVTQDGTRYDDQFPDTKNSIVQICTGFAPPPGITPNPPPAPSSLCGFVYNDANNSGTKQGNEAPIAGVTINLSGTDSFGAPVSGTTTTAADGRYCFTNLQKGTYTISEVQPPGYADGQDTQGTPGTGTTGNDVFSNITLDAGVAGDNNNFGEVAPSSLAGSVYIDANNDGARAGTEAGIAGVTVRLSGTDDRGTTVSMTALTGTDGAYAFVNLRPGTYTITETQPAAYADGKDTQGTPGTGTTGNDTFSNITLASGVSGQNNNFGEQPADTQPPTCTIDVKKGPPLKVTMTFRDSGSGIARFEIVDAINLTIGMPTFTPPSPGPLVVTGTRIIARKSDGMTIRAIDAAGNQMLCDPVSTTVTRLKHEKGVQTFTNIPDQERFVTVQNDSPGLRRLDVVVNGQTFKVKKLDDYEIALIDIASAMEPGPVNTVSLIPYGKKGDSALVIIADH